MKAGFLVVGLNDAGEVVVNHPDLKPDENGVGHIVFSPDEARHFAALLFRKASEADSPRRAKNPPVAIGAPPPVDRSARVLVSGSPVTEDHLELKSNGQQKDYVVLSAEERAKGFVRPVRDTYTHVGRITEMENDQHPSGVTQTWKQRLGGCGTDTIMGRAIAETYARDPKFYSGTFCCFCRTHRPLDEFVWKGTNEQVGS